MELTELKLTLAYLDDATVESIRRQLAAGFQRCNPDNADWLTRVSDALEIVDGELAER